MRLGFAVVPMLAGLAAAAAVPGAPWRLSVEERSLPAGWRSTEFAHRLDVAGDRARQELMEAPEIAWVNVSVRSTEDHAPLRVETRVGWRPGAAVISPDRLEILAAGIESWFTTFASVEVVFVEPGEKAGAR
ncbi:MAG TPA: hypothetical protein VK661_03465 [Planctomycetota bacterium]|nr:hypothetical protein [Planctomycetota bacterium]